MKKKFETIEQASDTMRDLINSIPATRPTDEFVEEMMRSLIQWNEFIIKCAMSVLDELKPSVEEVSSDGGVE